MENQIKLTAEELASVQELRESIRETVEASGKLNIRKHFIETELNEINNELSKIYAQSMELDSLEKAKIDEIVGKYGEGQLDFSTGIYTTKPEA